MNHALVKTVLDNKYDDDISLWWVSYNFNADIKGHFIVLILILAFSSRVYVERAISYH